MCQYAPWCQQLVGHCYHPDSCCSAPDHLMSASVWWTHLMALPVVLFSWEPCRRLERRFWAKFQQQHRSQWKPSLKAKLIKSPVTLLCLLTVCCHWGEAPLMRLCSDIHNGRLSNRKLLCCSCSCIGFTFLNNSQTSKAQKVNTAWNSRPQFSKPSIWSSSKELESSPTTSFMGHSQFFYHLLIFLRNQGVTRGWKGHCPAAFLALQGGKGWVEIEGQGEVSSGIICPEEVTKSGFAYGFCGCFLLSLLARLPFASAVRLYWRKVAVRRVDDKTDGFLNLIRNNRWWALWPFLALVAFRALSRKLHDNDRK